MIILGYLGYVKLARIDLRPFLRSAKPFFLVLSFSIVAACSKDDSSVAGGDSVRNNPYSFIGQVQDLRTKRNFSAGEKHTFLLRLRVGEALHVEIEQWGLQLSLRVLDAQGQPIRETSLCPQQVSPVTIVAKASGEHRLIFTSLDQPHTTGSYQATMIETRRATEIDEKRLVAEQRFEEGERLRTEWSPTSLQLAGEKFIEAAEVWESIGEWPQVARAWHSVGDVYQLRSEYDLALSYYQRVLQVAHANNLLAEVAASNNRISLIYTLQGKTNEGLAFAQTALSRSVEAGDLQVEAQAYNNQGLAYYYMSKAESAGECFSKALEICQRLQDRSGQAAALKNLGHVYFEWGYWSRGVDYEEESLRLSRSIDDRFNEAKTLNVLGLFLSLMGERQRALEYNLGALRFFERIGSLNDQAISLNSLGHLQLSLGAVPDSIKTYKRASEIYRQIGRPTGESLALHYIGKGFEILGDYRQALKYYDQALKVKRLHRDPRPEAHILQSIADVYRAQGRYHKALTYYHQASGTSRRLGDRQNWADSIIGIGRIYLKLGRLRKASSSFDQALALSRGIKDRVGQISALYNIAVVEYNRGNLKAALRANEAGLIIIEDLRTKVINQRFRISYFATVHQHYRLNIDLLMQLHRKHPNDGYDKKAFKISEMSRARTLLELLAEGNINIEEGADKALLEEENQLRELYTKKTELRTGILNKARYSQLLSEEDKAQLEVLEHEIIDLSHRQDNIRDEIKKQNTRYTGLTQNQPLALAQIQKEVLDGHTLLLEYALGERHSYLWVVSSDSFDVYELPQRAAIENVVSDTYAMLSDPKKYSLKRQAEWSRLIKYLGSVLLGPVYSRLGKKRLLIVADGLLHELPFAVLPAAGRSKITERPAGVENPLILTNEIVYIPSASTLSIQRQFLSNRKPASRLIAVFADAVYNLSDNRFTHSSGSLPKPSGQFNEGSRPLPGQFSNYEEGAVFDLPPLPFSREEANTISSLVPDEEVLLAVGFDATRERALSPELSSYRIIHFAVHGEFNGEYPELSGIYFTLFNKNREKRYGFVGLQDVYNLNLSADLVVLSACETALGENIKGEGLVGLPRGFMYAGAARVMATLWKVEDYHTSELLKVFYLNFLRNGMSPAAALRAAQIDMLRRFGSNAPYYWAGFIMQGEYK